MLSRLGQGIYRQLVRWLGKRRSNSLTSGSGCTLGERNTEDNPDMRQMKGHQTAFEMQDG